MEQEQENDQTQLSDLQRKMRAVRELEESEGWKIVREWLIGQIHGNRQRVFATRLKSQDQAFDLADTLGLIAGTQLAVIAPEQIAADLRYTHDSLLEEFRQGQDNGRE